MQYNIKRNIIIFGYVQMNMNRGKSLNYKILKGLVNVYVRVLSGEEDWEGSSNKSHGSCTGNQVIVGIG